MYYDDGFMQELNEITAFNFKPAMRSLVFSKQLVTPCRSESGPFAISCSEEYGGKTPLSEHRCWWSARDSIFSQMSHPEHPQALNKTGCLGNKNILEFCYCP